jgi:hypothetical protein
VHSFLNVYRAVLTDLNIYLNDMTDLNVYLTGLLQYIFLRYFYMQCSLQSMSAILFFSGIVGSLVHACFLHVH